MGFFVDKTGKEVPVANTREAVQQALSEGLRPRGDTVVLRDPSGESVAVPSTELDLFFAEDARVGVAKTAGARVKAKRERELLNKAEDFGGKYEAGGRAALRTIVPGVDAILGDKEYARFLKEHEDFSAWNTGGTMLGLGVGLASGGVFSKAGEIGTLGKVLGGAGGLVTRGAIAAGAKLAPRATGIAGKALQFGIEGALENTGYEATSIINDAVLLGDDFDVDAVGSRLLQAGLIGGGLGGLAGIPAGFAGKRLAKVAAEEAKISPKVIGETLEPLATKFDDVARGNKQALVQREIDILTAAGEVPLKDVSRVAARNVDDVIKRVRQNNRAFQNLDVKKFYEKNNPIQAGALAEKADQLFNDLGKLDELAGTNYLDELVGSENLAALSRLDTTNIPNRIELNAKTPLGKMFEDSYNAGKVLADTGVSNRMWTNMSRFQQNLGAGLLGTAALSFFAGPAGLLTGVAGTGLRLAMNSWGVRRAIGYTIEGTAKKFLTVTSKGNPAFRRSLGVTLSKVRFGETDKKHKDPIMQRVAEVQASMANPAETRARLDKQLAPVAIHNPAFAEKLAQKAMSKLEYYASVAPKNPREGSPFAPKDAWKPSQEQLSIAARTMYAGEFPEKALEDMFSRSRVDAVMKKTIQTLYPTLWDKQREALVESLMNNPKTKLVYSRRLFLSRLYDISIETTADPAFALQIQDRYAAKEAEEQQQQPRMPGVPPDPEPTKAQRLANR